MGFDLLCNSSLRFWLLWCCLWWFGALVCGILLSRFDGLWVSWDLCVAWFLIQVLVWIVVWVLVVLAWSLCVCVCWFNCGVIVALQSFVLGVV